MTTFAKWSFVAITLASSASATPLSTYPHHSPSIDTPLALAPLFVAEHPHGTLNNSYIVKLKQGTSQALITNHFNFLQAAHSADPLHGEESGLRHVYDSHKFYGYAGRFSDSVVEQLRTMPEVAYVEQDQIVRTQEIQKVQKGAPWGLARISHRPRLTFSTFTKYLYDPQGGEGVDVYVIDTGINIGHEEFEGRASWGKTIPLNDVDEDGNGHGTHCAGTIASRKYGVAKKANVIAVKVLGSNGSGSMSDVVAGVAFASREASRKAKAAVDAKSNTKHKGSVANMSLGGGKSRALDEAVNGAVDAGLHFAVAAGNDNRDACNYSPAAAEKAVTVGASTLGDERAYFSNYGECTDVFAPGLNILSTWIGSDRATNTISGTSMASPHTAGLLAYLLSVYPSKEFNPSFDSEGKVTSLTRPEQSFALPQSIYAVMQATLPHWMSSFLPTRSLAEPAVAPIPHDKTLTPAQLKKALLNLASVGVLSDLPAKTPNLLIFNNATAS